MQNKPDEKLDLQAILDKQNAEEFQRVQEQTQKDFFELHVIVRDSQIWNDVQTKDWFYRKNPKIGNFTPLDYFGKKPFRCKAWIENMIERGEEL